MKIVLIVNPRSGRGKASKGAKSLQAELIRRGHSVQIIEMNACESKLLSLITDSDRVVVVGGDGTVHHLLSTLAKTRTPMYHFGTGTANLISKEFGMSKIPIRIADHLESAVESTCLTLPTCNGLPFLIMVSIGIDASVIHRFEESRSKWGGYRAYLFPVLGEIISPRPARFVLEHPQTPYRGTGVLVIANMSSYGGGFNPCPDASPSIERLEAVGIPCSTSIGAGFSYGLLKLGRTHSEMLRQTAKSFRVTCEHEPICVQVDGEKALSIPGLIDGKLHEGESLEIEIGDKQIMIHAHLNAEN
jgi:diacylglycerol kinase (ATP)